MKLFVATNSNTAKTPCIKMLETTVISALKNTNFEVNVIFDGKKEELNLPKEVNIIEHRHRFYEKFATCERSHDKQFVTIASSAFLRSDIPYLCNKLGYEDEFVLYTDYDVLFQKGDYSELDNIKPIYFAACPEFNKNEWSYINSGSMLMNVKNLLNEDHIITNYLNTNTNSFNGYDQQMYNILYKGKWERMPIEYNWKHYWGINDNAKIIHFHGAKPISVEPEDRKNIPIVKHLRELNKEGYNYYNKIWESYSTNVS